MKRTGSFAARSSTLLMAMIVLAAPLQAQTSANRASRQVAKPTVVVNEAERARAHARDPSGDYKGYPDWARFALGTSRGGNSR